VKAVSAIAVDDLSTLNSRTDCHESFSARYSVVLEERRWTGGWPRFVQVEDLDMEEGAPLEFGGAFSHWYTERKSL
jgi:hypothetical protein